MSLKNIPKEELELLSYTDLAYTIIKDNQKPMNTPSIFKIICDLLEYSNEEYSNKIGDFYTSLTTDKKFLLLETAEWDLKENHIVNIVVEDEEEDIEEELDEEEEIEDEDIDQVIEEEDIDDDDDSELEDLAIIGEEELED